MSKKDKNRLNKWANNIQKEKTVYVSQMGSSVHAQGPYEHLTPGNPDFKKGASSVSSHQAGSFKSRVGRWRSESFRLGRGGGNKEKGSPSVPRPALRFLSSFLVSFPLSSGSECHCLPLFKPQCWQTGQTSWVGPWCQWVGTAAEVKRNGGKKGNTHNRVSFLDKAAFGCFYLKTHILSFITPVLHFCWN